MDVYHIWCDLKDSTEDKVFSNAVTAYLTRLQAEGVIARWRLMRRKLGLAPADMQDFHVMIETRSLSQLDEAFRLVAPREGPVEELHHEVYSRVCNLRFALYRDYPDE